MISRMGDTSDPELDQKLVPSEYRRYIVTTGFHFGEWNEPGSSPTDVVFPKLGGRGNRIFDLFLTLYVRDGESNRRKSRC